MRARLTAACPLRRRLALGLGTMKITHTGVYVGANRHHNAPVIRLTVDFGAPTATSWRATCRRSWRSSARGATTRAGSTARAPRAT
jgi:hypothetical protein